MLLVPDLNLGSIDAVNYRQRDQKTFLDAILYKEHHLSEIVKPGRYFLIGEKGTGKTSYSAFLENGDHENTRARIIELNATDYQKFIKLKDIGKLHLSSYSDIWSVILLLLMADSVTKLQQKQVWQIGRFAALESAISAYYDGAFKPEVDYSLELVSNSERMLGLMAAHAKAGITEKDTEKSNTTNFQVSLFSLQKKFEDALSSLKLSSNIILFIDGIDIRPEEISYGRYIECIRGLANAVWQLNTSFFSNIKDSPGRMKVCLLMRPDILDQMGFQNLNAKVRDNGVVLNWQTTYDEYASSPIFKMTCGVLASQQPLKVDNVTVWRHYFPYQLANQRISEKLDDPFVGLLRYSFYRPRDIIQYLKMMQEYVGSNQPDKSIFTETAFQGSASKYSDYLLGEVKDYLSFYYGAVDFDQIVGFFSMFGGRNSFSWNEFEKALSAYKLTIDVSDTTVSELKGDAESFLQFLYSLNIIGYLEAEEFGGTFVHWCFRDRTSVKLRPKVKFGLRYTVHPGLARSLLVGGSAGRRARRH